MAVAEQKEQLWRPSEEVVTTRIEDDEPDLEMPYRSSNSHRGVRWRVVYLVMVLCVATMGSLYLAVQLQLPTSLTHSPWYGTAASGSIALNITETSTDRAMDISEDDFGRLHPEDHMYREKKTVHLSWNVTLETRRPDGVARPVFLINGSFPIIHGIMVPADNSSRPVPWTDRRGEIRR